MLCFIVFHISHYTPQCPLFLICSMGDRSIVNEEWKGENLIRQDKFFTQRIHMSLFHSSHISLPVT